MAAVTLMEIFYLSWTEARMKSCANKTLVLCSSVSLRPGDGGRHHPRLWHHGLQRLVRLHWGQTWTVGVLWCCCSVIVGFLWRRWLDLFVLCRNWGTNSPSQVFELEIIWELVQTFDDLWHLEDKKSFNFNIIITSAVNEADRLLCPLQFWDQRKNHLTLTFNPSMI